MGISTSQLKVVVVQTVFFNYKRNVWVTYELTPLKVATSTMIIPTILPKSTLNISTTREMVDIQTTTTLSVLNMSIPLILDVSEKEAEIEIGEEISKYLQEIEFESRSVKRIWWSEGTQDLGKGHIDKKRK